MFGYVVANKAGLSEQQLARYRAFYCGLCRRSARASASLAA